MELPFRNHKQDLAGHFSATAQGENPWFRISILWTHFRSTITLEPLQPDRSSALLHPYFLVWSAPAGADSAHSRASSSSPSSAYCLGIFSQFSPASMIMNPPPAQCPQYTEAQSVLCSTMPLIV